MARKKFCVNTRPHPAHLWFDDTGPAPDDVERRRCSGVKQVAVGDPVVLGTGTKYRIKTIVDDVATIRALHPVRVKTVRVDELSWDRVPALWRSKGGRR